MSFYDHSDPNRSEGGQLFYQPTSIAEQAIAGVFHGDNASTAQFKVENQRRSMGLDPLTGLAPLAVGVGSTFHGGGRYPVDGSQVGTILWRVLKAIVLWPAAIALALGAVACAAALVGMKFDAPSLAARAAQGEFADYQPPLASLFSERELATPIKPAVLYAAFRSYKGLKASDSKGIRAHALMGQAYRCVLQPGCREGVAQIDEGFGSRLPREASGFFADRVKNGDEQATRDMCLFAVKAGSSYLDMVEGRNLCAAANALGKESKAGQQALTRIEGS